MKKIAAYKEQNSYWLEHPPVENMASVFDHMNVLPREDAEAFSHYMKNCYMLTDWVSPLPDPVDPSIKLHSNTYTDGQYFWNGMLAHFVSKYRADLPREFKESLTKGLERGGPDYRKSKAEYTDLDRLFVNKVNSGEYGPEHFVTI